MSPELKAIRVFQNLLRTSLRGTHMITYSVRRRKWGIRLIKESKGVFTRKLIESYSFEKMLTQACLYINRRDLPRHMEMKACLRNFQSALTEPVQGGPRRKIKKKP